MPFNHAIVLDSFFLLNQIYLLLSCLRHIHTITVRGGFCMVFHLTKPYHWIKYFIYVYNLYYFQLGEELWFTIGGQRIPFGASPQVEHHIFIC
jgi:hypothetical protein